MCGAQHDLAGALPIHDGNSSLRGMQANNQMSGTLHNNFLSNRSQLRTLTISHNQQVMSILRTLTLYSLLCLSQCLWCVAFLSILLVASFNSLDAFLNKTHHSSHSTLQPYKCRLQSGTIPTIFNSRLSQHAILVAHCCQHDILNVLGCR